MAVPLYESGHQATSGTSTSVTITAPTNIAVDDIIFLTVNHDLENQAFTWPSGFTEIMTDGWRFEGAAAWKLAVSADTSASDYTISWTNSDTFTAMAWRVSGADTTSPINQSDHTVGGNAEINSTSPSVTTTVDDCLVMCGAFIDDNFSITLPSGLTQAASIIANEAQTSAYTSQATAGATSTYIWTGSYNEIYSWTIAVAPDAGGGGGNAPTGTIYGPLYGPMGGPV